MKKLTALNFFTACLVLAVALGGNYSVDCAINRSGQIVSFLVLI